MFTDLLYCSFSFTDRKIDGKSEGDSRDVATEITNTILVHVLLEFLNDSATIIYRAAYQNIFFHRALAV